VRSPETISARLPVLVIHLVSNLEIVSAGKTSRLLVGFQPRNLDFAIQTNSDISISSDSPGDED
jgi:hypothetical protein